MFLRDGVALCWVPGVGVGERPFAEAGPSQGFLAALQGAGSRSQVALLAAMSRITLKSSA